MSTPKKKSKIPFFANSESEEVETEFSEVPEPKMKGFALELNPEDTVKTVSYLKLLNNGVPHRIAYAMAYNEPAPNPLPKYSPGQLLLGISLMPIAQLFWESFVLLKLWTWFVVPLGGLSLSLPTMVGINLFVSLLIYQDFSTFAKDPEALTSEAWYKRWTLRALVPLFVLGTGALVHTLFF